MARKTPADPKQGPDFETSLAELESLVERLERGDNDGLELDVLPGTDRSAARRNDVRPPVKP